MREAAGAARAALTKPVEGTILSVATAAADEAYRLAVREPDFYRLANAVLRAANDALDRTPEQLPALKEAGVVDSGGAGLCYFLEGVLRFLPEATVRTTAFPRRPVRSSAFTRQQVVGDNHWCTEFVLEDATVDAHPLRDELDRHGDSLLVIGARADDQGAHPLRRAGHRQGDRREARHGDALEARGHGASSTTCSSSMRRRKRSGSPPSCPGAGFDRIARELGADVTIPVPPGANPSVRDLLVGVNASLAHTVYLLPNDPNVALAAREVGALSAKTVIVVPSTDPVAGLAVLLRLGGAEEPVAARRACAARSADVHSASVFFAGKDASVDGVAVQQGAPAASIGKRLLTAPTLGEVIGDAAAALGAADGGLVTLYYGGSQRERDAQKYAAAARRTFQRRGRGILLRRAAERRVLDQR